MLFPYFRVFFSLSLLLFSTVCLADQTTTLTTDVKIPISDLGNPAVSPDNYVPLNGIIPDQATAVQVGEAILNAAFGKDVIKKEEPFKATLENDVWHVSGTLPQGWVGGTGEVYLSKSNGRVIKLFHSQ